MNTIATNRSLFKKTNPLPENMSNAATTLPDQEIELWNSLASGQNISRNKLFRQALLAYAWLNSPEIAEKIEEIRRSVMKTVALAVGYLGIGITVLMAASGSTGPRRVRYGSRGAQIVRVIRTSRRNEIELTA